MQEWTIKPGKPDNHWFDCLVGCAVAASMCDVRFGVERAEAEAPPMIRLSELQKGRR